MRRRARVTWLAWLILAASCAKDEPRTAVVTAGFRLDGAKRYELQTRLPDDGWKDMGDGIWVTPDPFAGCELPRLANRRPRLLLRGKEIAWRTKTSERPDFSQGDALIRLRQDPEAKPPRDVLLGLPLAVGRPAPPLSSNPEVAPGEARWRTHVEGLTSDGIPLVAGHEQSVTVPVPRKGSLRFATTCVGPVAASEIALYVEVDGVVFEPLGLVVERRPDIVRHELPLPAGLRGEATFRFSIQGPPALVVLHAPVVVPEPPPRPQRPNILLFVADTFRADNLTAYGSEVNVTPVLDALAKESKRFEEARAPAAWTLPSHVSLFLGLHPYQHGSTQKLVRMTDGMTSLAEWLSAAGYRTGAVTNSLYVSERYGMDRGFEWFEEHSATDLQGTLDAAVSFMEASDGRPTFLFVHTYRVHGPYRVEPPTVHELAGRLDLLDGAKAQRDLILSAVESGESAGADETLTFRELNLHGEWMDLLEGLVRSRGVDGDQQVQEAAREHARRIEALYRGGVFELDRALGGFLEQADRNGFAADEGFVVFTSDHGEAFAEHDALFHGVGVWDEVLRIPLLIRGPGIEPGGDERVANLVDLAATIARIAQLSPAPFWEQASLLHDPLVRTGYTFDCAEGGLGLAVILDGDWKIVLPADPERIGPQHVLHAFDLAADPIESKDLKDVDAKTIAGIVERRAEELRELLRSLGDVERVELDEKLLREMADLGYFGAEAGD